MNVLTAPIALVDRQRQILVIARDGRHIPQSSPVDPGVWGSWSERPTPSSAWSWPTWSPDGLRIAAFRIGQSGDRSVVLHVGDVDGVAAAELVDLKPRLPIYLSFAPDGRRIGVLSQLESHLVLSVARVDASEEEMPLAEGSPLFFTWVGPSRVAAFVGGPSTHRLALFEARPAAPTVVLPGEPTNFCAPVVLSDGRILYVARHGEAVAVVAAAEDDAEVEVIEPLDGLVALIPSPHPDRVARAVASGGDGTPYRDLVVLDVGTGERHPVLDEPILAFLWVPTGDRLVVARVDTDRNAIVWSVADLRGRVQRLVELQPTRDLGFYLRFFEQYAQSHALVDPTGKFLLLSGKIVGRTEGDHVWQVNLDTGHAEPIAEGLFGIYGPR